MRTTIFRIDGDRVVLDVEEKPPWQPFTEYDGKPLDVHSATTLSAPAFSSTECHRVSCSPWAWGFIARDRDPPRK